jgi:hypothetical protein
LHFEDLKDGKKHLQTNTEATSRRDNPEIIGPKHGDTDITPKKRQLK